MSKKSYMNLLKEAISEFDTSDNLEVKGPMLDPILSWDGDGEIPTQKDAAGILERYYFNEKEDKPVETLDEADYENDKGNPASGESMKNAKGTGTEQAGTSDSDTVLGGKEEKKKDIAKEAEDMTDDAEEVEESEDLTEDLEMENAIIEKLISEMEDDDDDEDEDDKDDEDEDDKDDEEEMSEAEVMNYKGDGPKESMPKEKKASDPEEDTKGAGTEQAGTGTDDTHLPDRKDKHDDAVKPKKYTDENTQIEEALKELEEELLEADDMEDDAEDVAKEKELNVDKKMKESSVPGGPSPKKTGEDWEDDEKYYSEAFEIFKEAIDSEDEDEKEDEEKEE
jgi:hypothetical protein